MAYDEGLAARLREELDGAGGVVERKMFGGVSFIVDGNMAVGVIGDELCVRVGPDATDGALDRAHTRLFDFTGRPMRGWILVGPDGYESDEDLTSWVVAGTEFAASLPPK